MKQLLTILLLVLTTAKAFSQCIVYYKDQDGDGFGGGLAAVYCSHPPGWSTVGGDCNDGNPNIKPGATEVCNQADDNCNGSVDEGLPTNPWYRDNDQDGYGGPHVSYFCYTPSGTTYVSNNADCDDFNSTIHPGAQELCGSVDENCNGNPNDGVPFYTYYYDADNDGYGGASTMYACAPANSGWILTGGDCNDGNPSIKPAGTEVCNSTDDNCDGTIDEGIIYTTYYLDYDHDGYGSQYSIYVCYNPGPDYITGNNTDCDDYNPNIHPGAQELCSFEDENCVNGGYDGVTFYTWYYDNDGDGYGGGSTQSWCSSMGSSWSLSGGDCNDQNNTIHPAAQEICNAADENCNGQNDEGITYYTYYFDNDGDGYGSQNELITCNINDTAGTVTNNTDCDDLNSNIYPGSQEICNGADDNCDGNIDEGLTLYTYYFDSDDDGYGGPNSLITCHINDTAGTANNDDDCDDSNSNIHPGAQEICNGADDNCNGSTDEGLTIYTYYFDSDGDGYGGSNSLITCHINDTAGTANNDDDCDDNNSNIHPGAQEICNGADDNCNGSTDEGLTLYTYYFDSDDDGYGGPNSLITCHINDTAGTANNDDDCDDNNSAINPGAQEVCNYIDDDCDGLVDENTAPFVDIQGLLPWYFLSMPPTQLMGIPPGGIFSGQGVIGNMFHPALVPPGAPFVITYTWTSPAGCEFSTYRLVTSIPDGHNVLTANVRLEGQYGNQQRGLSTMFMDTVEISLADTISPYNIIYTCRIPVSSAGEGIFNFPPASFGNSYYLVFRHRNSLETWSKYPVLIDEEVDFDLAH